MSLRKQLLEHTVVRSTPEHVDSGFHAPSSSHHGDHTHVIAGEKAALGSKILALEKECKEERRGREVWQGQAEVAMDHLKQTQIKVIIISTLSP